MKLVSRALSGLQETAKTALSVAKETVSGSIGALKSNTRASLIGSVGTAIALAMPSSALAADPLPADSWNDPRPKITRDNELRLTLNAGSQSLAVKNLGGSDINTNVSSFNAEGTYETGRWDDKTISMGLALSGRYEEDTAFRNDPESNAFGVEETNLLYVTRYDNRSGELTNHAALRLGYARVEGLSRSHDMVRLELEIALSHSIGRKKHGPLVALKLGGSSGIIGPKALPRMLGLIKSGSAIRESELRLGWRGNSDNLMSDIEGYGLWRVRMIEELGGRVSDTESHEVGVGIRYQIHFLFLKAEAGGVPHILVREAGRKGETGSNGNFLAFSVGGSF